MELQRMNLVSGFVEIQMAQTSTRRSGNAIPAPGTISVALIVNGVETKPGRLCWTHCGIIST
jgi:hypothetical protein